MRLRKFFSTFLISLTVLAGSVCLPALIESGKIWYDRLLGDSSAIEQYQSPISLYNRALSLAHSGELDRSEALLERYLSETGGLLPRDRALELLADINYLKKHDPPQILDLYEQSYALVPLPRVAQKIQSLRATTPSTSTSPEHAPEEEDPERTSALSDILSDQQKRAEYINTYDPNQERADRERIRSMIDSDAITLDPDW